MTRPPPDHIRAPRQRRAQATLERILHAAEELLRDHLFEQVTMAQVAQRARVSVGTIYTRFADKDALLPALFERHNRAVEPTVADLLDRLRRARTLAARIEHLVHFTVRYHRDRRGLLRALTMYTRAHPEAVPTALLRERSSLYREVARIVAGNGRGIGHPDPVAAVEFALLVLNSVTREHLLFGDLAPTAKVGVRALETSLVAMLCRYLAGTADSPTRRTRQP